MLVVKRKMNTIKQPNKGTMLNKGPSASHNFLTIVAQKMILKVFSTPTFIMAQ
jgi:hypothetical protein